MFCFILLSVLAQCYTLIDAQVEKHNDTTYQCKPNITNLKNEVVNLKNYCVERPCISKCCGENEVVLHQKIDKLNHNISCANILNFKNLSLPLDYSNLNIYKSDIELVENNGKCSFNITESGIKTNKSFLNDFNLVQNKILLNESCGYRWNGKYKGYLLENGNLMVLIDNHQGIGWTAKFHEMYCVDRIVFQFKKRYKTSIEFFVAKKKTPASSFTRAKFLSAGFLTSSFFLLLVLVVYCMLPHLRNLSGMLLMSYVTPLLLVFLMKAYHMLTPLSPKTCKFFFSPFLYFFFLSSILWLNVMSFDVWWSFRGMRLLRDVNRKGELVKYGWYSLYVWGVASAMTAAVLIIDNIDLSCSPHIVKPSLESCLAAVASSSSHYYWYIPIGILILVNMVLFTMTVYNMCLVGKAVNRFNSNSKKTQNKSRFRLYLKLSLVMGIFWAIEVAQSFYDDKNLPLWVFVSLNLYTTSIGVLIFILFIFNRNTMVALCKRFNIKWKFVQDSKKNCSTKSTTISRSQSSTNKGSTYTKTRCTEESEIEMDETEVLT